MVVINIHILVLLKFISVSLWNSLVVDEGITDPLKRFLRLDHVIQKLSFDQSMVIWDVFIEWNISSSNSYHHLVTSALDNLLGSSDQINLPFHMNDWNGDIQLGNKSFDFLLKSIIISLFS